MRRPVVLEGLPKQGPVRWGFREAKMLRPNCEECAPNTAKAPPRWWEGCKHDPYVGAKTFVYTDVAYEDEVVNGKPTGNRVIASRTERQVTRPWPNLVQVSLSGMHNWGRTIEEVRARKGYIMPEELRSPAFPYGIARFCEFRDCFSQTGLKVYGQAWLCRKEEALRIYEAEAGLVVEVNDQRKRQQQISERLAKVEALTS